MNYMHYAYTGRHFIQNEQIVRHHARRVFLHLFQSGIKYYPSSQPYYLLYVFYDLLITYALDSFLNFQNNVHTLKNPCKVKFFLKFFLIQVFYWNKIYMLQTVHKNDDHIFVVFFSCLLIAYQDKNLMSVYSKLPQLQLRKCNDFIMF